MVKIIQARYILSSHNGTQKAGGSRSLGICRSATYQLEETSDIQVVSVSSTFTKDFDEWRK